MVSTTIRIPEIIQIIQLRAMVRSSFLSFFLLSKRFAIVTTPSPKTKKILIYRLSPASGRRKPIK